MKLFAAALLVVFFVGAALAEEAAAPAAAEQPAAAADKPAEKPAAQPAQPNHSKIIAKIVAKAKELITKITNWLRPISSGISPRAATNMAEKKKKTLAKIDAMKAQLQAKDKSIVVPASPANKRAEALAMKAAIAKVLQDLELLRAEISKK